MEQHKKSYLIARIVSGNFRYEVNGRQYCLKPPTIEQIYLAEELFGRTLDEYLGDGLMDEAALESFLFDNKFWSEDKVKEADQIDKDIDEFKVKIFECKFRSEDMRLFRGNLRTFKQKQTQLYNELHAWDHLSAKGLAERVKYKFLIGCSVHSNGKPIWENPPQDYRKKRVAWLIDNTIEQIAQNRISEAEFRELARTDPWRSTWNTREVAGKGILNKAAVELSDEQRTLLLWSSHYDNIYQSPERPSESVVNDDDALDGWIIVQRRKQAKEEKGKFKINNSKVANSSEIFVLAQTPEDAMEIEELNSEGAKMIKRQKMRLIAERGIVGEMEMPDVRQKFQMELNQYSNQMAMRR